MSISLSPSIAQPAAVAPSRAVSGKAVLPLYLYAVSLAALLTVVGILWDISWHRTIGRDKFLSPPHILIYLGALFAGLFSGIRVLWNSFARKEEAKKTDIRIWGIFYSPMGSLFCIWGAIAMLTSAPFDDWWHNAYGLDVTILSPPHTLLGLGMIFLQYGACVSIVKYLNAGIGETSVDSRRLSLLRGLFIVGGASLLCMVYTILSDYLHTRGMRGPFFYIIASVATLLFLPAFGKALRMRWGMTAIAGGYFFIVEVTSWVLQLFPAEPKLGPILTHLTHFQPFPLPLLIFIPAAVMDTIQQRSPANDWVTALFLSGTFVGVLLAVQYPLSGFLLESPGARNWFFGAHTWYYGSSPDAPFRYRFRPDDITSFGNLLSGLFIAFAAGTLLARLSLGWGRWLQQVKR